MTRNYTLVPWILAIAFAAGCGASPCKKVCRKLAECQGLDPDDKQWQCPIDNDCSSPLLRCQASCAEAASCDALTGKDADGVAAIAKCQAKCAEPDGGDKKDPPMADKGGVVIDDAGLSHDLPPKKDTGVSWPDTNGTCSCEGRQCGDDGCGNSCGSCTEPKVCNFNTAQCIGTCYGECSGKECGDDGCGGSCGSCSLASEQCVAGKCTSSGSSTFGSLCDASAPNCDAGLGCAGLDPNSPDKGFCTKTCSTIGDICEGSSSGTLAACLLEDANSGMNYCIFMCAVESQTWPCPQGLTCDPEDNPPGSGQRACY